MLPPLKEIINVCESKKNKIFFNRESQRVCVREQRKIRRIFFNLETYTREDLLLYLVDLKLGVNLRAIVINLIIVN